VEASRQLISSESTREATALGDSLEREDSGHLSKSATRSRSVAFENSPSIGVSKDLAISSLVGPSDGLGESAVIGRSNLVVFSVALLSSDDPPDSSSVKASRPFTPPTPIQSPTPSEEAVESFVLDSGVPAAQNSGAIGSGLVAGTVVSATVVVGVVAGLIFLFLLRLKRKEAVPVNVDEEDQELVGETFECSDVVSGMNGSFSDDMEESLNMCKPA
jgi:hypothetical protein